MEVTGPLFKWFGSKWSSARLMPAPKFDVLIEPFAGSAGYSLRHYERDVILCESDTNIFKLWRWLINDATEADIRSIPINLKQGTDIRKVGLSYGQALLLKTWQRTNNVGDCWTTSSWGNKPGQWTTNTRSRVASEFHAVRHWKIKRDFKLAIDYDHSATWFIDPPYKFNYQYRAQPLDYSELANRILGLRGQVMVCEAVCPKTGQVPDWLPFTYFGSRVTSRRKTGNNHHSKELVWINK